MTDKRIIITGASDGIGKALAFEMAKRGFSVGLTARRTDRLEQIKAEITTSYPSVKVEIHALDVTEYEQVSVAIENLAKALGGVDIVMANAGIAIAGKVGGSPLSQHLQVIDTNVNGAIATVDAALKVFQNQGYGHIVATSSVAAYRGLPRNAAYSASKAALSTFMEGVRAETYGSDIDVSVLHPGYIDTEINRELKSRPFVINVEKGAEIIADMIQKKVKRAAVPPFPWRLLGPALGWLPTSVIAKM